MLLLMMMIMMNVK